jgi:hypothetical protein
MEHPPGLAGAALGRSVYLIDTCGSAAGPSPVRYACSPGAITPFSRAAQGKPPGGHEASAAAEHRGSTTAGRVASTGAARARAASSCAKGWPPGLIRAISCGAAGWVPRRRREPRERDRRLARPAREIRITRGWSGVTPRGCWREPPPLVSLVSWINPVERGGRAGRGAHPVVTPRRRAPSSHSDGQRDDLVAHLLTPLSPEPRHCPWVAAEDDLASWMVSSTTRSSGWWCS